MLIRQPMKFTMDENTQNPTPAPAPEEKKDGEQMPPAPAGDAA